MIPTAICKYLGPETPNYPEYTTIEIITLCYSEKNLDGALFLYNLSQEAHVTDYQRNMLFKKLFAFIHISLCLVLLLFTFTASSKILKGAQGIKGAKSKAKMEKKQENNKLLNNMR